jgi:predicted lipoprotein with Yx(FWY)xxD motif
MNLPRPWRTLALCAAVVISTAAWSANDLYIVSPSGSDRSRGDLVHPLRTLREAVQRARPGDTIALREGTYAGSVVINNPGRADAWITLRNHAGEKATVLGDGKGPTVYFYHPSCDEYARAAMSCASRCTGPSKAWRSSAARTARTMATW